MKRLTTLVLLLLSLLAYAEDKPIITVLDLKTDQISEGEMSSVISLLSSSMFRTNQYKVIDVAQRETILKELEFSVSGCTDEGCQVEIGKLLAAEYIVVGNIGKLGNKIVLSLKMLETSTSQTISTADGIYNDLDSLVEDVNNLSRILAGLESTKEQTTVSDTVKKEPSLSRGSLFKILGVITGVAGIATGSYFMYRGISHLRGPVEDLYQAYMDIPDEEDQAVIDTAWSAYWEAFKIGRSNLVVGISTATAGFILGGVSFILPIEKHQEEQSAIPTATLSYRPFEKSVWVTIHY